MTDSFAPLLTKRILSSPSILNHSDSTFPLSSQSSNVSTQPSKTSSVKGKNYFSSSYFASNSKLTATSSENFDVPSNENSDGSESDEYNNLNPINSKSSSGSNSPTGIARNHFALTAILSQTSDQQSNEVSEPDSVKLPFKLLNDISFSQEGYCVNYEDRSFTNIFSSENQNVSMLVGYLCLTMATVFFISTIFSLFIAPFLQPTTHFIIEFLRTDNYYCFLIPLLVPVTAFTVYANWISMKFFKHS